MTEACKKNLAKGVELATTRSQVRFSTDNIAPPPPCVYKVSQKK